jgi:YD repeat-containing protein
MDVYKAPVDLSKAIVYDNRNRATDSSWNNYGSHVVTTYDAAGRVTGITTNTGETTVAFGYDAANRKLYEDQTVAGYPTRRVLTNHDPDGNRSDLAVYTNGGLDYGVLSYDYTHRSQLAGIKGGPTSWFTYSYDLAGNLVKRQDVYNGVNDSMNLPGQYYDGLNRPTMCEQTQAGDALFARSWYQFDKAGRETATWRDEQSITFTPPIILTAAA